MMWQDLVFMTGSFLSIAFLAPTLRDATSCVPLGTSLPSVGLGIVYGVTFGSLGMTFSAVGALAAGGMWALIAVCRSPATQTTSTARRDRIQLFVRDARRWLTDRVLGSPDIDAFVPTSTDEWTEADPQPTYSDYGEYGHPAD